MRVLIVAALILAGCTSAPVAGQSGEPSPTASGAPLPSTPASTTLPSLATTGPTATPTAPEPSLTPAPVPQAEIVTGDATVPGTLGSYAVDGRGSDGPWLPFATLPSVGVGAKEVPTLQFVDGTAIGDVEIVVAPATDTDGSSTQGVASIRRASDGHAIAIGPLPVGRWVLSARLFRVDGRGDGTTYWAVIVQ